MTQSDVKRSQRRSVGFVGCCLPRRCGIATFTYDLYNAAASQPDKGQSFFIAAVNDRPEGYDYPDCVEFQVNVGDPHDYQLAAEFLNEYCSVVCLQHEFGIFGRSSGSNVIHLLSRLRIPLVVTCHTVPIDPDPEQREVFTEVVASADRLVVMNRRAVDFLQALYGARYDQIAHIDHGIHDVPFQDPPFEKKALGVRGSALLSFGLLGRNKGLEYMIDAMPRIVSERPEVTYVIVGATHPRIVEQEGESYRTSLRGRARSLGVEDHVRFIGDFCDLPRLMAYLAETDIFVAPYLIPDQMTSGALSYAAGAGKAVVATPFLHARDLLADGRGRLVPVRSPQALARNVLDLLADRRGTDAMRRRVYQHTRGMVWPMVAREYTKLFEVVARKAPRTLPFVQPLTAANVKQRPAVAGGPVK